MLSLALPLKLQSSISPKNPFPDTHLNFMVKFPVPVHGSMLFCPSSTSKPLNPSQVVEEIKPKTTEASWFDIKKKGGGGIICMYARPWRVCVATSQRIGGKEREERESQRGLYTLSSSRNERGSTPPRSIGKKNASQKLARLGGRSSRSGRYSDHEQRETVHRLLGAFSPQSLGS